MLPSHKTLPLVALLFATPALAESGKYNLHLKLAASLPPGPSLEAGFDWQFKRGIAVDALVAGGWSTETGFMGQVTGGMRFRFADDHRGYADEKNGSVQGNFYLAPHAGVLVSQLGAGLTTDMEVGYEWSVKKPVQIGVFMRPGLIVADFVAPYAFVGVQASIEFEPMRPSDTDRDGVIDSRDRCPGTPAGEVVNSRGCPPPKDSDRDGVPDPADRCPDTPQGISVDAQGCPILPKQLVLDGVLFEYGSTEILSESDDALRRARRILLDNPTVRVEISGHTDNTGDAAFNRTLSKDRAQAVADWLVAHGVDPAQLTTAGYGSDQPAASNSTEEGRKQNRRIEFHRLD